MSRQIVKRQPPPPGAMADVSAPPADSFAEQIVKLLPVESVAVFLFIDGVITGDLSNAATRFATVDRVAFLVACALCLIGTPLYLRRAQDVVWTAQLVVSTVGFACWAFATSKALPLVIGTPIPPVISAIVIPLFTFFAPLLLPKKVP